MRGAFTSHDAALAEVDAAIPPSAYNAYLKTANTRRYPTIHGPMTDAQALAILRGTLKLLAKGDITDEQLETYEEDANRMRAYAALTKVRALTLEEQLMVDQVGPPRPAD